MIEITGVRKRFGPIEVLDGIDLTVAPGRVTALVGPNGCGKTTLIKTLLGLVRADAGRVAIDGHALNGDWRYRERIGYMPQLPRFPDNLSSRDVITLLEELRPEGRRDRTLLDGFGLEDQLDRPIRTLSVGNRQRVNAAMAFLFDPDVLILDEPTAGLDPTASALLKDHVLEVRRRGRTVMVTSHVMAELEELADDVAFLLDGRIRFRGTLRELRTRTGEARLERAIARLMRDRDGAPDGTPTGDPAGRTRSDPESGGAGPDPRPVRSPGKARLGAARHAARLGGVS
ncbi:MAG: ABC transporter ATP-binding protein [Gemmatimonadota bacterium]|jgi:Cu-processing system ATP-binding protein